MKINEFQIGFDFDNIGCIEQKVVTTNMIYNVETINEEKIHKIEEIKTHSSLTEYEDDFDMFETPVTADLRTMYNNDIGTIENKLLTLEEEKEYFEKIKNGDLKARERFIELNLKLVVSVAKSYNNSNNNSLSNLDIIQEGNMGLLKAVEKFDPSKGHKFSTFAVWWINQSIKRALEDKTRLVRIPNHRVQQINKINKFIQKYKSEYFEEPSISTIAQELNYTEKSVKKAMSYNTGVTSINSNFTEDKETEFCDILSDGFNIEDHCERKEDLKTLNDSFSSLDEQERDLIVLRYYKNYKISQIVRMLDMPRNKINKILDSALSKMKTHFTDCSNY